MQGMGKRFLLMLVCIILNQGSALGAKTVPTELQELPAFGVLSRTFDSETLQYTVEKFTMDGAVCFLTKIWMTDPGRQIRKATAEWRENIQIPAHMARQVEGAVLVINGSGYVSPRYPWIPDNYPGGSADYYYTPLGSLTVTDGEVFRNLEGVPYYGLTLQADGLHLHIGEENASVLAGHPEQTWSFYVECPMLLNNEDILPAEWAFADRRARRTVIGRADSHRYVILSVTDEGKPGISLRRINRFFQDHFQQEWLYNLDGGPSSALLCRSRNGKRLVTVMGGKAKDADIMAFTEIPNP